MAEPLTVPPAYDIPLDLTEVSMLALERWYRTYGKAIWAVALAILTAAQTAAFDGHLTRLEWVQIAIAATTAVLVWLIPIHPQWPGAKTFIAALLAILNAVATVIMSGVTGSWSQIGLAVLTVLLVGAAPARSTVATGRAG